MNRYPSTPLFVAALLAVLAVACVDAQELPSAPFEPNVQLGTHVTDWRDEVIYQVIVDRFADGDPNNNFNVDTRASARYHGGDWQGLIDKLDYLQALGVTTVWITPVVKNVEEDAGFASYHGYWTQDFLKHNPHFGDLRTLRELSDALHARGMKLILDVVTNHVGQVFFYDINGNGRPDEWLSGSSSDVDADPFGRLTRVTEYDPDYDPRGVQAETSLGESGPADVIFFHAPDINRLATGPQNVDLNRDGVIAGREEELGFANPDWYNRRGRVTDWDKNPPAGYVQGEQTLWGDFPGGLKDLRTSKPEVQEALIQAFTYWIDVTDADGFRIDTLKHVEFEFWEAWAPAMRQHAAARGKNNFLMFGEVFDGRDELLGAYTGPNQVDSVFYFSQKFRIFDDIYKCAPGNTANFCAQGGGNFRRNGTAGMQALYDDRLQFYSNTPQPGGVTDANGNGLAPQQMLVNFIDNHDVPRFLYDRQDANGIPVLHNALTYLFMVDGIPCLYYGTEQAFFGGNDPRNREDMWEPGASIYGNFDFGYGYSAWNTDSPTFLHVQRLTSLRRTYPQLRYGNLDIRWTSERAGDESDAGILAFERNHEGRSILVVANTHETKASRTRSPVADGDETLMTSFGQGTVLVDVLAPEQPTFTVGAGGSLDIEVPAISTRILVPQSDLL